MFGRKIKIGLSNYGSKIHFYIDWLNSFPSKIEIVKLHHSTSEAEELLNCTGLLLTGGSDINPKIYGQTNNLNLSTKIDDSRDEFEIKLLDIALKNKLPILGICRGLQLVNAHLGGSLLQHIYNHKNTENEEDLIHQISVVENSYLFNIVKIQSGVVNSSHHQAVDKVAKDLVVSAQSDDGIIEALEWIDKTNRAPLLLVQWHPERMKDINENPFSKEILNWFIKCQIN